MNLNENSPMPLYYQLENLIREKIEKGIYGIDQKIPSERSLSQDLNLSRMTVSKAINSLVEEGILYRKRGQGTFVSKSKVEFFPGLKGFTEIIKDKGMNPSSKLISQDIIYPDQYLCEKLKISENEKVIFTQRLRLADEEIINLEKSYIPYNVCPELLEIDLSNYSIYEVLSKKGYKASKAKEKIQAILSDEELSNFLKIDINEPILKRKRTTYSKDKVIEHTLNYYKADVYDMVITLEN